jgi:hypothetical protein
LHIYHAPAHPAPEASDAQCTSARSAADYYHNLKDKRLLLEGNDFVTALQCGLAWFLLKVCDHFDLSLISLFLFFPYLISPFILSHLIGLSIPLSLLLSYL